MLITPAMASEPYWAAAPSCSTSMWSMAEDGIMSRSAAAPPWNTLDRMARLATPWRRLPLTSTSTWLGLRPLSRADRVSLAMSPPMAWALNEGTARARAWIRPGDPVRARAAAPRIWIGAGLSTACRPETRVPVTITSPTADASSADAAPAAARHVSKARPAAPLIRWRMSFPPRVARRSRGQSNTARRAPEGIGLTNSTL